jgi:Zn-dependent metalloprotease
MNEKGSLLDDAEVRWDESRGCPMVVRGDFPLRQADTVDDATKGFLAEHADELRLPAPEQLEAVHTVDTPTGQSVRFAQTHDGLPVVGSEVVVVVDNDQRVRELKLDHETRMRTAESAGDTEKLKPSEAVKKAKQAVGATVVEPKPPKPVEAYYPTPEGLRRAYVVHIPARDEEPHDWRVVMDAYSGEVLDREDLIVHIDGQGLVFDPNPVVTAHDASLRDPDATTAGGVCAFNGSARATVDAQRVMRVLRDIKLENGKHRLDGPFVRMRDFGAPATTFPEETNATDFNYSSGDDRFEAVNIYYHIDTLQRYLQSIGVTTAHNRVIECDPHYGPAGEGAFFSSIDGGLHFGDSGPCNPDRGEDGHVMAHEYGHAIQNDQVPGWGATNPVTGRAETRAMGEGFGDALATIFFCNHGGGFQREVFEQWIWSDVGGLRRVDGTKVYPTDWAVSEHANGEIWSAAIWNIFRAIGGDSSSEVVRDAARRAIIKSLVLSHHRLPASASMPEGAEAVMVENAALPEYRGAHLMQMLDSFHARGLLVCDPAANLEISDGPGNFFESPNLWVRHDGGGGTAHQEPEYGQQNWFYARVQNNGSVAARAFVVTFNATPWAGTEFVYPGNFVPYISAVPGFNLAPGASTVVKAPWPRNMVPAEGSHVCILASVYTPTDVPPASLHVWEHDNLAQKNVTVVDLLPDESMDIQFQFGNLGRLDPERFRLEVVRPQEWPTMPLAITHSDPRVLVGIAGARTSVTTPVGTRVGHSGTRAVTTHTGIATHSIPTLSTIPQLVVHDSPPVLRFLEPSRVEVDGGNGSPVRLNLAPNSSLDLGARPSGSRADGAGGDLGEADVELVEDGRGAPVLSLLPGRASGFPLTLPARTAHTFGLKITAPPGAKPGETLNLQVVQRDAAGTVVGGIGVQVNIVAKK